MYVGGNPIQNYDPFGGNAFSDWWTENITKPVAKASNAVADWWDGDNWTSRATKGLLYAGAGLGLGLATGGLGLAAAGALGFSGAAAVGVGAAISGTAFGLIGGTINAAHGDSFLSGFGNGFIGGAIAGALGGIGLGDVGIGGFGISLNVGGAIGGFNGLVTGLADIYSHDGLGALAFFTDSTIGLPTTAIGLGKAGIEVIGSGNFDESLSKQSNAFIFQNSAFGRSSSVGNVVGISAENRGDNAVLREELLHSWQYRRGGALSLLRLGVEQAFADNPQNRGRKTFPYFTPGTLEYEASSRAQNNIGIGRRPWELGCRGCGKFF